MRQTIERCALSVRGLLASVLLASALLLTGNNISAQALYGTLVGNISDPQAAFLPGVSVAIINTGTGLKQATVTDENGGYIFRNLLPGNYEITISGKGFKETKQTDVAVTAGNPKRVDIMLQIGGAQETVTVAADASTLKTEKSDLSSEITAAQVTSLPLNQYRNYQSLLNLIPGATPTQMQNAEIDSPGRSLRTWVNGTQPSSNTTRIDGAVSVNLWLPHHAGYIQPAETIETVNVATNNFDADIGMAAGAAQSVVTKSGTNQFHGSGFWFQNYDELNANSLNNNAKGFAKPQLSRHTYGGTLGGPIKKDKLFFFGSYEKFRDRRGTNFESRVPTEKMRIGDFSEVAAAYNLPGQAPKFKLYNPLTGNADGTGRTELTNFIVPSGQISDLAKKIMAKYPKVNSTRDLNGNSLLDDYSVYREVQVDRANYDTKINWQRTQSHAVWGKLSMLRSNNVDEYRLGFDNGSLGDTKVYVISAGHTWTLSPTLLLDGNFGYFRQDQTVTGPDYGKNIGIELGIPGTNDPNDIRASGMPTINNGYQIGSTPSWMPLFRKEINYTFSSSITKVFSKHELRAGAEIVRFELNHRQAEFGDYGLRGGLRFDGNITSVKPAAGVADTYTPLIWNNFAAFLIGNASYFAKDTQTEDMSGREWQNAIYVRDRWRVTPNLTFNLGLRLENYPLMSRANSGIERLDLSNYTVLLGGRGDIPRDVGIDLKSWYLAPRLGVAYRLGEKSVIRAGYGRTINPLPWSRPMRGSFPYDINFNRTADPYLTTTSLATGIPPVSIPDLSSGIVTLPKGVFIRTPNTGTEAFPGSGSGVDRGIIQQWNIAFEHKLPGDIITEVAYVGTRTDGGYADLNINYGEPGGGNAARKYASVAGSTDISDWAARTKSRYNSLQVALNRPIKNGLLLKGAYTFSNAKDMTTNGEDGWVGLTWNHKDMFEKNFTRAIFDRPHVFQMGAVYDLPFLKNGNTFSNKALGGWQLNGIFSKYSGTPFNITGTNSQLSCSGCGTVMINVNGNPEPTGTVGSGTETYYDKSLFSQPTGATLAGFGNAGRHQFRRPSVWNLDLSLFKKFKFSERFTPEFRVEAANIFNNANWGAPIIDFASPNFLKFLPENAENGTNSPGARRIQLGLRVQF